MRRSVPYERRTHVRKHVDLAATYQIEEGDPIESRVADLSLGGALVGITRGVAFGSKVRLSIALPENWMKQLTRIAAVGSQSSRTPERSAFWRCTRRELSTRRN